MLYPLTGGKKAAYTRASTAAKWADSQAGLINWKASQAMIGMAKSKPLQARVASIVARTQEDAYRENKAALKEAVETATTIAQSQGRATYGTAMHEMSELLDAGSLDWSYVPEKLKGPLEAYAKTMSKVKVLDSEVFVAVDQRLDNRAVRIAGSMDRVLEHPDYGPVVADLKSGADEPRYPMGVTTQVAIYSKGLRYRDRDFHGSPNFHDGSPNPDGKAWRKELWPNLNQKHGLMIHCPLERGSNGYECNLYLLDLERGWGCLKLGHQIQQVRRFPALKKVA